jgi:hypothetical protein
MFESLQILSQADEKGVLGFAIARNRRKIAAELPEYLAKRDELLAEYGTDAGAGKFTMTPEAAQKFSEALRPFAEITTEVDVHTVTPEAFCSGTLTSSQMYVLDWMVEEASADGL